MRNLISKIRKVRIRLNSNIEKRGLTAKEVKNNSSELNELINVYMKKERKFPLGNLMHEQYKKSYKQLSKIMLQFNESISAEAWNKYAKENNYLNSESMKYISRLNWNELKSKINIEKNNF